MVADRHHVRPRLVDAAVNDALGEQLLGRRLHRLGVEGELEHVGRLDQLRRARARQEVGPGSEGWRCSRDEDVEHACRMASMRLASAELVAEVVERGGHAGFLLLRGM